jgi:hypothetical protein
VTGAGDVADIQVAGLDQPVHVHMQKIEPGHGAEVTEQPRLDILGA